MILLIDNYDSFSYNLYQMIGMVKPDIKVIRNDEMSIEDIKNLNASHIVLSPGPGYPKDAGICVKVTQKLGAHIPILGVCLGHQAICEAFGATISYAEKLMHGKQSDTLIDTSLPIFKQLPQKMKVARYHSLAVLRKTLPDCLKVTAQTDIGEIMGVSHKEYPVYGVQFHPESILTPNGLQIIKNFLNSKRSDNND